MCKFHRKSNSVYKYYVVIRGKLKQDGKFKCQTFANQQKNIAEDCLGIELCLGIIRIM